MKKKIAIIVAAVLVISGTLLMFPNIGTFAQEDTVWTGSVDTSWYRNTSAKEYKIRTAEELAGLANIVNGGENFEGKTIYLENDIVLNEGDSSRWNETAPKNEWTPIGEKGKMFKGTFDGRGHTVSGMYISYTTENGSGDDQQGFFGIVAHTNVSAAAPAVRNISVVNSYINNACAEKVGMLIGQVYVSVCSETFCKRCNHRFG